MKCRIIGSLLLIFLLAGCGERVFRDYLRQGQELYDAGDYAGAYEKWSVLAHQGNAEAQTNLGSLYFHGHGIRQGIVPSLVWYRRAAEQGHARAQYYAGLLYIYDSVEGDVRNSLERRLTYALSPEDSSFIEFEPNGHPIAVASLSMSSQLRGKFYLQDSAEQGFSYAMHGHARFCADPSIRKHHCNDRDALEFFELAIQHGNADAMLDLAMIHEKGSLGAEINHEKMVYFYNLAAESGSVLAMERLGDKYFYGDEYHRADHAKALDWYQRAAQKIIDATAIEKDIWQFMRQTLFDLNFFDRETPDYLHFRISNKIGALYLTDKNYEKALYWFQSAADAGNFRGATRRWLAWLYSQGKGMVEPDIKKAIYWYERSAKNGDAVATITLAHLLACEDTDICNLKELHPILEVISDGVFENEYYSSIDVSLMEEYFLDLLGGEEEFERKYYWLDIAFKHNIGIFISKFGLDVDGEDAIYDNSETNVLSLANRILGEFYVKGETKLVNQDLGKAVRFLRRAATPMNEDQVPDSLAMMYMGDLYFRGIWVKTDRKKAREWYRNAAERGNELAQWRLDKLRGEFDTTED